MTDMAAQHGLQAIGAPFEGYMGDVDFGFVGKFGKGEVRRGAVAGRPISKLAWVGFGKGHQVGDGTDGGVGPHHYAEGVAR